MKITYFATALWLVVLGSYDVQAQSLAPYKDGLFSYGRILESRDDGAYRIVDYNELRDINQRDQVPERRVRAKYVTMGKATQPRELTLTTTAGAARFAMVGTLDGARVITLFVHGRGGDRQLGQKDWTFGGNFNRIKNLMLRNKGVYLTVDAGSFSAADIERIGGVALAHLEAAPGSRLVLACGSAGGAVCHGLANDSQLVPKMAGIAFLGSYGQEAFASSVAAQRSVPVFIAHGSRDTVFALAGLESFYKQLRTAKVPVRMVNFNNGGHGTPIRMTDWRSMINWMLVQ